MFTTSRRLARHHAVAGRGVALADPSRQLALFGGVQQRRFVDLAEVRFQRRLHRCRRLALLDGSGRGGHRRASGEGGLQEGGRWTAEGGRHGTGKDKGSYRSPLRPSAFCSSARKDYRRRRFVRWTTGEFWHHAQIVRRIRAVSKKAAPQVAIDRTTPLSGLVVAVARADDRPARALCRLCAL